MYAQDERRDFFWEWTPGGEAKFMRILTAGQQWYLTVPPGGFLTVTQAAVLLDVATVRVNEWVREGRIKSDVAPDGTTVVPLRAVAAIEGRGRHNGPVFPPGTFR
jgi:hypothetical protein